MRTNVKGNLNSCCVLNALVCRLFVAEEKLTEDVRKHLAPGDGKKAVEVLEYDDVVPHLRQLVADKEPGKLWVRNTTLCSNDMFVDMAFYTQLSSLLVLLIAYVQISKSSSQALSGIVPKVRR